MRRALGAALGAALLGLGCAPSGPEALMATSGAAPYNLNAVPWPSDALLGDDGLLKVALPFPFQSGSPDTLTQLASSLSELDGFGVSTSIFFPLSGDVTLDAGASATVVDLQDPSQIFTFPLFYRNDTQQLAAMAPLGTCLKEHHLYGAYVLAGVHDRAGHALHPSAEMQRALDGEGPIGKRPSYAALAKLLAAGKLHPLVATAFTTQTLTAWTGKVMSDLQAMPPKAHVTRVFHAGAELDELFGGPVTTTRPGRPSSGGVLHSTVAFTLEGTYDVPHYLSATPGTLGLFDSVPTVKSTDHVPFILVLPQRAAYAATPVVIWQHGINDDRKSVLEVADSFTQAGYAVLGIDELWHGSRLPGNVDKVNNLSGDPVPDGIGDPSPAGAIQYFFDFKGDQQHNVSALDVRYIRDNFRQATIDLMQEVRLAKSGDVSEVAAADPALAGLTLDGSHLVYMGESFGSILGAEVMALDPEAESAMLDVGGGGLLTDLVPNSASFAELLEPFFSGAYDGAVDVGDPDILPVAAQMSLQVVETLGERGDGLALAGQATGDKQILFLEAFSDETVSNPSTEALAQAWGAVQVTLTQRSRPTARVMFPEVAAPYDGAGKPLRALVQLDPSSHGQFTLQNGLRQYMPGFPPFMKLPMSMPIDNPIEIVRAIAVHYVDSVRAGHPVVFDPTAASN